MSRYRTLSAKAGAMLPPPLRNGFLFFAITLSFHVLWKGLTPTLEASDWFMAASGWMAQQVYQMAGWINSQLPGLDMVMQSGCVMGFPGVNTTITVTPDCSGIKQLYQALVLFALFPGPWRHKLWFIPAAMAVMFITNILRINILSVVLVSWPDAWTFAHDWVLRPFFYVVLFGLWILWIEKISISNTDDTDATDGHGSYQ